MTTRWFRNYGSGRGAPGRRAWPLALAALSLLGLNGCACFGGGDPCAPGPRLFRPLSGLGRLGNGGGGGCGNGGGLLKHKWFGPRAPVAVDPCEPGIGAVPIEAVGPGALIPGAGPVLQSPPALRDSDVPSQLEPADPPAPTGTAPQSRNGGAVQSFYEADLPSNRSAARVPESASPPAPGAASVVAEVLSELPPLDANLAGAKPTTPLPDEAPASPPAAEGAGEVSAAPGIARFRVVEPQLAGGSLPTAGGWSWLADRGYKTVVDLRERSEVQPGDLAAIDRAGLIHIGLPITAETIDAAHLDQFAHLLAQAGSRPLFFFDTDGSRASVLWYVHRVASGKADAQTAAREAAEIGPNVPKYWVAATAFLARLKPAPSAADPGPPTTPAPDPAPAAATPPQATVPADAQAAVVPLGPPATAFPGDPVAWKPYAAVIVTTLGVPLAYYGRSAINFGGLVRASLPAPERSPRPLPDGSGD